MIIKNSFILETLLNHFNRDLNSLRFFIEQAAEIKIDVLQGCPFYGQISGVRVKSKEQPSEKEIDLIKTLRRMESRVENFMGYIKTIETLYPLYESGERDTSFFNNMIDELADRLKQSLSSANS